MKRVLVISFLVVVFAALPISASALTYTASETFDQYMSAWPEWSGVEGAKKSVEWTFYIGGAPVEQITEAVVDLSFSDDGCDWFEIAKISLEDNRKVWEVDNGEVSFSVESLVSLNTQGELLCKLIACFGDFVFNSAHLTATTEGESASIPDPAPVFLLATAGLVGFVGTRKKRII